MSDIGLFEAIHTARSLRRLKPDPVPEALITQVLDAAIRASTAGNAQNWAFVVVRDPAVRRAARRDLPQGVRHRRGDVCREGAARASHRGAVPSVHDRAGAHLWEHMGDAPVILIPCLHRPFVPQAEGGDGTKPSLPMRIGSAAPASIRRCRTSSWPAARSGSARQSRPTTSAARTSCARCSPARRRGQLRHDADRLAGRSVRPTVAQAARRGRARGRLGRRVAGCMIRARR